MKALSLRSLSRFGYRSLRGWKGVLLCVVYPNPRRWVRDGNAREEGWGCARWMDCVTRVYVPGSGGGGVYGVEEPDRAGKGMHVWMCMCLVACLCVDGRDNQSMDFCGIISLSLSLPLSPSLSLPSPSPYLLLSPCVRVYTSCSPQRRQGPSGTHRLGYFHRCSAQGPKGLPRTAARTRAFSQYGLLSVMWALAVARPRQRAAGRQNAEQGRRDQNISCARSGRFVGSLSWLSFSLSRSVHPFSFLGLSFL